MITFSTSSCPGAGGSVHWCVHHLRAAGRGSGGVGVGGSFPPQQVIGVPQGSFWLNWWVVCKWRGGF